MARYTGPRTRISRRFGIPIFGPSKYLERRNYVPGVHGPKSRRKFSDYALGLLEKQKFRYFYGLQERQFRNVYEKALRMRGRADGHILNLLGIYCGETRDHARQATFYREASRAGAGWAPLVSSRLCACGRTACQRWRTASSQRSTG